MYGSEITENCPSGELTLRTLAMPADANPAGDIFGGWVLSQMDIAAGICAAKEAKCRVATVGIEAMSFLKPIYVGDVLCVYSSVNNLGFINNKIKRSIFGSKIVPDWDEITQRRK